MRWWWQRAWLAGLLFLAGYLSLAQPGLCPYWLVADVSLLTAEAAAADGHAHHHTHDHNQQREYFVVTTAPARPEPVPAAAS
ncbi:MAG: hypothetical protein JNK29_10635, partial [Anaerolineales bacterium]|nr:hypothetical protein [Anaerolineales bacterium]